MKKVFLLLMIVALFGSNAILVEAKKREVVIPKIPKQDCKILKKEMTLNRVFYARYNDLKKSLVNSAANDLKLELKRNQTTVNVTKKTLAYIIKSYKEEEIKPIVDIFNTSLDGAFAAYSGAVDKAFLDFKTNMNNFMTGATKTLQKSMADLKKNLVCSGDPKKDKDDNIIFQTYRGEGFGSSVAEFRDRMIEIRDNKWIKVSAKAQKDFKSALSAAEKTKNNAIKLLKKAK